MRQLIFSPKFRRDVVAAARYYEQQQTGLGMSFRVAVERGLEQIIAFPLSGIEFESNYRRHALRQFPYHILYRVDAETLTVVNQRRRPRRGQ